MSLSWWRRMQQDTGWPWGPLGTLFVVTACGVGLRLFIWAFFHAFVLYDAIYSWGKHL